MSQTKKVSAAEEVDGSQEAAPSASTASNWQSVWDDASQAWYWWDPTTNTTTWDDPADPAFAEKQKQAENKPESDDGDDEPDSKADSSSPTQPSSSKPTATFTTPAPPSTNPTADYYNSAEYYNWYYSQYGQPVVDPTPQQPASELDQLLDTIDTTVKKTLDQTVPPRSIPSKRSADGSSSYDPDLPQNKSNIPDLQPVTAPTTTGQIDHSDYTMTASFDRRTGRFRPLTDPRFADPQSYFDQASKAARQCNFFFDYEGYQQERAAKRLQLEAQGGEAKKEKKLTKKELEFYKNRKKERKASALRARYAD